MSSEEKTRKKSWLYRNRWRVLALISIVLAVCMWKAFLELRNAAQLASCRPNLILTTCLCFAENHEGDFLPLSSTSGEFSYSIVLDVGDCPIFAMDMSCDFDETVPPIVENRYSLPYHRRNELIGDHSYVYLGYALLNEADGQTFLDTYAKHAETGSIPAGDWTVEAGTGTGGADVLYALRETKALASVLGKDADDPTWLEMASKIPVVVEWPEHHMYPGGKVVYLDYHTEFVEYPGKFPMTEEFIEGLKALDK